MGLKLLTGGKILLADEIVEGRALLFSDRILALLPEDRTEGIEAERRDVSGAYISPGFIDVHVNGAGGADALDAGDESLDVFCRCLAEHGVTAFLPTVVTAPKADREAVAESVRRAMKRETPGAAVLGLHLEGPWIDENRRGAHPLAHIEAVPDAEWVERRADVVRMVTFSPRRDEGGDFLRTLLRLGIVPSLGHTDADFDEAMTVLRAGAKSIAHLFNAQSGLHHRAPGMVGAALCSRAMCELIADGAHVRAELFEPLCRAIGTDRLLLVTDSMRAAGLSDGEYDFAGRRVRVEDGVPRLPDGTLAGSALTMNRAVRNMWRATGRPLPEIVGLASANPAKLLGLEGRKGSLAPGNDADLLCFDENLEVLITFVGGRCVHTSQAEPA
ncbi:MAG: N-acetylglucosamine-6-phosphate deacetylase [Synergistaceae bacterium]|jgi:N-acetylglucosamine-6-phosphate deacetylase|nr:N-acetylglucosamine-6-phosphate deacetylase [Synergistaceae bacterium]